MNHRVTKRPQVRQIGLTQVARFIARGLVITAFGVTVALASWLAFTPTEVTFLPWDKAEHFVVSWILTWLGLLASPRTSLLLVASGVVMLGGLAEYIQAHPAISGDGDFGDWIADICGVGAAIAPLAGRWFRAWLGQRAGSYLR